MKKIVLLITISILFVSCKDNDVQDTITPKTQLVTKISSEKGVWDFTYDSDLRLIEAQTTYMINPLKISFFYNEKGQIDSSATVYVNSSGGETANTFEYDDQGQLIRYFNSYFDRGVLIEKDTTEISLTDEGLYRIHPPGADWGSKSFRYEGDNMKNIICFDCVTSGFDHTYMDKASFLPKEFRRYWNIYTGKRPIGFLSYHEMGSEDLLKDFFDIGPNLLPVSLQNEYETDPDSGQIISVKSILTSRAGYYMPTGMKAGDVWATYEFTYSEF